MLTTNEFLQIEENLVSTELKVSNPSFLKSGVLGMLINTLAVMKSDNANYLNSLVKESSAATAENYESLFFHSTIKQIDIEFSKPATFVISFIVPELTIETGEVIKYYIGREVILTDSNGYDFTLEDPIEIYLTNGSVRGRRYNSDTVEELDVYRVKHPLDNSQYIYLVNTEVEQYKRIFKLVTIPDLTDDSYKINIEIPNINNIYKISAWRQKTIYVNDVAQEPKTINLSDLRTSRTEDLATLYELQSLDVKYTKNLSNQTDEHIFVKFNETSISFETGDGIYGRKPKLNEKILLEIQTTEGKYGNLASTEFTLSNIVVQQINVNGIASEKTTTLKAVSVNGGSGGLNLESKEDIRQKLLNTRGDYIGTIADIKYEYLMDSGIPFIDKKYFNSRHNIFVYNIIRESNGRIIPTMTRNIKLAELEANPFLPEYSYNGVDLISPFYFVNFKNRFNAYLILPEVKIDLTAESGTSTNILLENNPTLFITYDWFERKTYIELRGTNINNTYIMNCNINSSIKFAAGNSFRVELNKTFLNSYCLLDGFEKTAYDPDSTETVMVPGYLTGISLTVYNSDVKVVKFIQSNTNKYTQVQLKQSHYYWIDVDLFDTTKETKYILNIPYIEKEYITKDIITAAQKIDSFFKVIENRDRTNPNIEIIQAFYNNIKIEDIYRNYIFETTEVYIEPVISINMEVTISSLNLQRSKWLSTTEMETDIIWITQEYQNSIEGYDIKFNESQLEQVIQNYFNSSYQVIENIKVWNPSGPIRVRDSSVIYALFEDNFGSRDISLTEEELNTMVLNGELPQVTQKQIVDFVPPYFSFSSNVDVTFKIN